jgi:uncharacterized protein YigA (DUF484 family)
MKTSLWDTIVSVGALWVHKIEREAAAVRLFHVHDTFCKLLFYRVREIIMRFFIVRAAKYAAPPAACHKH